MRFQTPLIRATLLRRYKRFLCDIRLDTGQEVTAHCPNPGSMLGLAEPGCEIWVEPNNDPKKKLKYGWRLVKVGATDWAGIDTSLPNKIVREALLSHRIEPLANYSEIRAEVPYGDKSRIDFLLMSETKPSAYVEVKSVTLKRDTELAEFPDCITTRGAKHLIELCRIIESGQRAIMIYVIQRTDCTRFRVAANLDPNYGRCFEEARAAGVEMLCYDTHISPKEISLKNAVKLEKVVPAFGQG
ncbi:MAG: DNA/RNA nuclease SfsA [Pseudomonadota bacterium]